MTVNNIYSDNPNLVVDRWVTSAPQTEYDSGCYATGEVRYNRTYNILQGWDGSSWQRIGHDVSIKLDLEAYEALEWVKEKRDQEQKLKLLAAKHITIADVVDQITELKLQLDMLIRLTEENQDV